MGKIGVMAKLGDVARDIISVPLFFIVFAILMLYAYAETLFEAGRELFTLRRR